MSWYGPKVTALVPAHNEEAGIGAALDSLLAQTTKPARIVVVLDNCTDATEAVARGRGVEVIETVNNTAKKAGALNIALDWLNPGPDEAALVLDADSILDPGFITEAIHYLKHGYAACGGNFRGQPGAGFLGMCQRNEYARYARDVARLKGRCLVLTGTATLFQAQRPARRAGRAR